MIWMSSCIPVAIVALFPNRSDWCRYRRCGVCVETLLGKLTGTVCTRASYCKRPTCRPAQGYRKRLWGASLECVVEALRTVQPFVPAPFRLRLDLWKFIVTFNLSSFSSYMCADWNTTKSKFNSIFYLPTPIRLVHFRPVRVISFFWPHPNHSADVAASKGHFLCRHQQPPLYLFGRFHPLCWKYNKCDSFRHNNSDKKSLFSRIWSIVIVYGIALKCELNLPFFSNPKNCELLKLIQYRRWNRSSEYWKMSKFIQWDFVLFFHNFSSKSTAKKNRKANAFATRNFKGET